MRYLFEILYLFKKIIRKSVFSEKLSGKINFHNFHHGILTPLGYTRSTIPKMFVFIKSKMDHFK